MDTAAEILLLIVSAVLAVFLLIAIIAIVKLIQVLNMFRRVAAQAEHLAETAEEIGQVFKKSAKPVALGSALAHFSKIVFKKSKK